MSQDGGLGPRAVGAVALTLSLLACVAPDVSWFCVVPANATEEQKRAAVCECLSHFVLYETLYTVPKPRPLDLLVVVGNTAGMVAKQRAFAKLEPWRFLLSDEGIDLHLGIVSTDVGSWVAEGTPFAQSAGACDSFAGDDGMLQATSCLARSGQTAEAKAACAELCPDRRFVPSDGRPFLAREFGRSNVPTAIEVDARTGSTSDRGMEYALGCTIVLGESGCEISSPLEAAKRALDGHRRENSGFLRPGVPLYIVFLSDRDDCSMQLARRPENDPAALRCDPPDHNASPRCFRPGPYRCFAADAQCDQPLNQAGDKTYCRPRSDSPLVPVADYQRFLTELSLGRPWLFVEGIVATPALGQGARIEVSQQLGTTDSAGLALQPACRASSDPRFFGLPQHRLSDLRAPWAYPRNRTGSKEPMSSEPAISICDVNRYRDALDVFGFRIDVLRGVPGCLPGQAQRDRAGQPNCLIGYVPNSEPQSLPDALWPSCSRRCCDGFAASHSGRIWDPTVIAACEAEPQDCYCVVKSQHNVCRGGEDGELVGLWPKFGETPPAGYDISVRCSIDPSSGIQCAP